MSQSYLRNIYRLSENGIEVDVGTISELAARHSTSRTNIVHCLNKNYKLLRRYDIELVYKNDIRGLGVFDTDKEDKIKNLNRGKKEYKLKYLIHHLTRFNNTILSIKERKNLDFYIKELKKEKIKIKYKELVDQGEKYYLIERVGDGHE